MEEPEHAKSNHPLVVCDLAVLGHLVLLELSHLVGVRQVIIAAEPNASSFLEADLGRLKVSAKVLGEEERVSLS